MAQRFENAKAAKAKVYVYIIYYVYVYSCIISVKQFQR